MRTRLPGNAILITFLIALALSGTAASSDDLDGDGLPDDLEQALLEKFRPTFILSSGECDIAPAAFTPGAQTPIVMGRNGTIYGQVFKRAAAPESSRELVEIHYYHLWSRDCGRWSHSLDVEHVAALVESDGVDEPLAAWQAKYWYAAAHEDTLCVASRWRSAPAIHATNMGAKVWISAGKHASYLMEDQCAGGCGSDRCGGGVTLPVSLPIINVGEIEAPLNGALWTRSPAWPLQAKMGSAFPDSALRELALADTASRGGVNYVQGTIATSGSTLNALITSNRNTAQALTTAQSGTLRSLDVAYRATTKSLQRTLAATRNFLRLRPRKQDRGPAQF